ncbi:hypothetical protein HDU76_000157 [Blyttiomyces sp. JEL0837]|nr:hypothetical protein HDU76_000157 [Blyttiomyces sp. JEL0837]
MIIDDNPPATFLDLPNEIIRFIAEYLHPHHIPPFKALCKESLNRFDFSDIPFALANLDRNITPPSPSRSRSATHQRDHQSVNIDPIDLIYSEPEQDPAIRKVLELHFYGSLRWDKLESNYMVALVLRVGLNRLVFDVLNLAWYPDQDMWADKSFGYRNLHGDLIPFSDDDIDMMETVVVSDGEFDGEMKSLRSLAISGRSSDRIILGLRNAVLVAMDTHHLSERRKSMMMGSHQTQIAMNQITDATVIEEVEIERDLTLEWASANGYDELVLRYIQQNVLKQDDADAKHHHHHNHYHHEQEEQQQPLLDEESFNHSLIFACKRGHLSTVQILLSLPEDLVNPGIHESMAFMEASLAGHFDIVKILLGTGHVNPSAKENGALLNASSMGRINLVKLLLSKCEATCLEDAMLLAVKNGHGEVVRLFLEDGRADPTYDDGAMIVVASQKAHDKIVDLLCESGRVDPGCSNNLAIRIAAECGHAEVVRVLLRQEKVDAAVADNLPLRDAVRNGRTETVRVLLSSIPPGLDGNVNVTGNELTLTRSVLDPSANDNEAIKTASAKGFLEIVELLLDTAKVDPTASEDQAIRCAAENGHAQVVKALLNTGLVSNVTRETYRLITLAGMGEAIGVQSIVSTPFRTVDPGAWNNAAIRMASQNGHAEVVRVLLSCGDAVDPAAMENEALVMASKEGHSDVVGLLLGCKRVDPAARKNDPIASASARGHVGVVDLLLKTGRVDPTAFNNYAVVAAAKKGHVGVLKLLMEDGRVDLAAHDNEPLLQASGQGHADVVALLLKSPKVSPLARNGIAVRRATQNGHDNVIREFVKILGPDLPSSLLLNRRLLN